MRIKHLRTSDRAVTGTPRRQAPVGVAVEFWARANPGLAGD